ncbi:uncharacterized protein [Lolium perenne]|uniref:uncharacterized protein n=1 Tax=Lolium perenne TaxID=4522 RepID=UPI0021F5AC5D|nr:uncharacterized protein LOC127316745 [Lolium perenne]
MTWLTVAFGPRRYPCSVNFIDGCKIWDPRFLKSTRILGVQEFTTNQATTGEISRLPGDWWRQAGAEIADSAITLSELGGQECIEWPWRQLQDRSPVRIKQGRSALVLIRW